MLILQNAYKSVLFLFWLICAPLGIYADNCAPAFAYSNACDTSAEAIEHAAIKQDIDSEKRLTKPKPLSYYLYTVDFIDSFIEIPTSNVAVDGSTISSKYLAGRAAIYNLQDEKVGTCSASFLCMQNADGIFTDISNYLAVDNGLVVSWFTPTTLVNLELDSIIHSMVTECIVVASTKIGFNPFYGKTFNMIVSSDDAKIFFTLTEI